MKARLPLWLAAAALGAAGLASSMALAGGAAGTAKAVTVKSAYNKALKKTVLVTGSGLTLYRNTTEKKGHVRCGQGCTSAWPPLLVPAGSRPTAGTGVAQAKLGTIRRPDGRNQVTFTGMPLYRFAADRRPGDAKGQGIGAIWFVVTVAGSPSPSPTSSATTTTETTPTSTGYTY